MRRFACAAEVEVAFRTDSEVEVSGFDLEEDGQAESIGTEAAEVLGKLAWILLGVRHGMGQILLVLIEGIIPGQDAEGLVVHA